jgi:hypothetical protein
MVPKFLGSLLDLKKFVHPWFKTLCLSEILGSHSGEYEGGLSSGLLCHVVW